MCNIARPNKSRLFLSGLSTLALASALLVHMAPEVNAAEVLVPSSNGVLSGSVVRNGQVAEGASVTMIAWPTPQAFSRLTRGKIVPTLTLSRTASNAHGELQLDVSPASLPPQYKDLDGAVNFDVVMSDGQTSMSYSSRASIVGASSGEAHWRSALTNMDVDEHIVADLVIFRVTTSNASRSTANQSLSTGPVSRHYQIPTQEVPSGVNATRDVQSCHWVAGATKTNQEELWTYAYGWSGATVEAKEEQGTSHHLGIALQVGTGSWGSSGTATLDEANSTGRTQSGLIDKAVHNRVNHTEYTYACIRHTTQHKWSPTSSYALITDLGSLGHWYGSYCTNYTAGTFTTHNVTNETWTNGMNISGVLNVSSQAGWTSDTELEWTIKSSSQFCGNSSSGIDNSWQVEAR